MKHKHHDVIVAWAADTSKVVQVKGMSGQWQDCDSSPIWSDGFEYRIKPEPKPDVVIRVKLSIDEDGWMEMDRYGKTNLRLTFDGETGKLKAAEVLE